MSQDLFVAHLGVDTKVDGHIVKIDDDKLTMVGEDKKEVTHPVPKEAKITLDGKEAKLKDLKPHTKVYSSRKHEDTVEVLRSASWIARVDRE